MLESKFQSDLIKKLKKMFPNCIVMKNDSSYIQGIPDLTVLYKDKWASYIQGIPDLTVLYKDKWAVLECKKESNATHQPNQDYYIGLLDKMSFARFIYPENKEEVLNELQQAFCT